MRAIDLINLFDKVYDEYANYFQKGRKFMKRSRMYSFLYTLFVINNTKPEDKRVKGELIVDYDLLKAFKPLVTARKVKFGNGDHFKNIVRFINVNPKTMALNVIKARIDEINAMLNEDFFWFEEHDGVVEIMVKADEDHLDERSELVDLAKKLRVWKDVTFLSPHEFKTTQKEIVLSLDGRVRTISDGSFESVAPLKGTEVIMVTEAIKVILMDGFVYVDGSVNDYSSLPVDLHIDVANVIEDYAINIPVDAYFENFSAKLWVDVINGMKTSE